MWSLESGNIVPSLGKIILFEICTVVVVNYLSICISY